MWWFKLRLKVVDGNIIREYVAYSGLLKMASTASRFHPAQADFFNRIIGLRWLYQTSLVSPYNSRCRGRKPLPKTPIFIKNVLLEGLSWTKWAIYRAAIFSKNTPLSALPPGKISGFYIVPIMSYEASKLSKKDKFRHFALLITDRRVVIWELKFLL
jgi:hypothetical protein